MIKGISFGGMYGAVRVNFPSDTGLSRKMIVQDYYPFKNEFKSEEEKDKFISVNKRSYRDKDCYVTEEVKIKEELPFTEDEFFSSNISNDKINKDLRQFRTKHPDMDSIIYSHKWM